MLHRRWILAAFVAVVAGLASPMTSKAAFRFHLKLESTGKTTADLDLLTIPATNVGAINQGYSYSGHSLTDLDPGPGNLWQSAFFNIDYFGYNLQFVIAKTNSPDGDPAQLILQSATITRSQRYAANTGAATTSGAQFSAANLKFTVSATDYYKPEGDRLLGSHFAGQFNMASNALGATAKFTSTYDSQNKLYGIGGSPESYTETNSINNMVGPLNSQTAFSPGTHWQDVTSGPGTFSLTNTVQLNGMGFGINNTYTGDLLDTGVISPVPAPPGLILAATALPFFGLLRRRLKGAIQTA